MLIAQAIKAAIRADGRSLCQLGAAVGVSPGLLSRFMRGERTPTLDTADRIIRGLNLQCRLVPRGRKRRSR